MPWTCLVQTCDSNKSKKINNNVSTFKVPDEVTEKERYEKWIAAIPGCSVLKKNHRICEKHFRTGEIIKEYVSRNGYGQVVSITPYKHPRLLKEAIPCLFSIPGQKLDSHVYSEHAYVTKSPNSFDKTSNSSEKSCVKPESNKKSDKCKTQEDKINLSDSCVNNSETIPDKQQTGCHSTSSNNIPDSDKELPKDATMGISTSNKTVIDSNRLSKLPDDRILTNSATTAIFQSVTFDFDGKPTNPNARIKLIIDLVKPWNAARAVFGDEEYLILSHIVETDFSGKKSHTLEKAVLISKDRKITYEVYGRPCDVDHYKLSNFLENVSRLTEILKRFKDLPVCEGVKIFNSNFLSAETQNFHEQPWRPDDCTLISLDGDKCSGCQKQSKILSALNDRQNKNAKKSLRVSRQSNPIDQKKLNTMQNKTKHRARLRNRSNMLEKTDTKSK